MTERDPDFWPHTLSRLAAHGALTADEAAEAMRQVMVGQATPGQIGGLLMALRTKGETVDEIEGLARTMLEFASPVSPDAPAGGPSFKDMLVDSIQQVNTMQLEADQAIETLFTGGDINPAEVLTAVQKADLAFRLTMQMRNKLMEVYQEIKDIRI